MIDNIKEILLTEDMILHRVKELGLAVTADYRGKNPILIGVLKGAVLFIADLMRAVEIPVQYDFMAVCSYGNSTKSSGTVKILKDLDSDIEAKDIIIVEDIIDTGLTLQYLLNILKSRRPKSIKICALLDKSSKRIVNIQPDYSGFVIPDVFVVGYGLDYAEKYRNLPYIGVLKEEYYKGG